MRNIAGITRDKYLNSETRAAYLTSELLDCTSISSNGNFFHSLNSKEDFLESIGSLERSLLENFITENRDFFNEKSKDPHVQNLMAGLHMIGFGVEKDEVKAVELYKNSASQNYAPAQSSLADCYEHGIVVEKDKAKAVELYELELKNGYQEAANNIDIQSISTYSEKTDRGNDSTISSKRSIDDDSTISSLDSDNSVISLPNIKRHSLVVAALENNVLEINNILRFEEIRSPKFRKELEALIEYIDNGNDGRSFVAGGKGLGAVLDKDNYLFLSKELNSPLKDRIMHDYQEEYAIKASDKVMPKVKYDPKENRDEDHKEDNSPEEPPMAPPILANANNRPEVSAPLMLQEQSYQAHITEPSAPSLHAALFTAALNNNGKDGKSLTSIGASIYDPIDHGVSLAQNPLTLYAQNGRNKTVNDILSSSVTRDKSRTHQLRDVVRHIETAGVNGQSIVSGGLGSMLNKDNAEFLKQNMDYYISTKIVSDYNNLRMLKRVEQVPVAIAVAIQEPQEQRLQQIKTDPVHNVAEEVKEKKGEEVKKAITEVKKKASGMELYSETLPEFPEVPTNDIKFPEVPSGSATTISANLAEKKEGEKERTPTTL